MLVSSDSQNKEGVIFIMEKETKKSLLSWKPTSKHSDHRDKDSSKYMKTTNMVWCPYRTRHSWRERFGVFYSNLPDLVDRTPKRDTPTEMDSSMKFDSDNTEDEPYMGMKSLTESERRTTTESN